MTQTIGQTIAARVAGELATLHQIEAELKTELFERDPRGPGRPRRT
jgi:hypothetical protein